MKWLLLAMSIIDGVALIINLIIAIWEHKPIYYGWAAIYLVFGFMFFMMWKTDK